MRTTAFLAAATTAALMAGGASALTVDQGTCSLTDVTLSGNDADDCAGAFVGNDWQEDLDGLFGYDWMQGQKYDLDDGGLDGGFDFGLWADGAVSGGWGVDSFLGYDTVMVVVKGSTEFAAYLFDGLGGYTGTYYTGALSTRNGNTPALSHISIYVPENPAPIPVPAAGLLLAGALAGLGLATRRKG